MRFTFVRGSILKLLNISTQGEILKRNASKLASLALLLLGLQSQAQILKKPIPDKLVVLTFDDAVLSHYTNVAPLLKKYKFGGTFFVTVFM